MTSADRIELRGLTVRGNHGVFDFEKREGQDFVIDVVLHTSTGEAARTDNIDDTIHYGSLAEDVAHIVEDNTFDLIETLAERIADHCLSLTDHAEVVVHKPSAPIQRSFQDVSVTVDRHREGDARVHEAMFSLGANLGDAQETIEEAIEALDRHPRIAVVSRSSFYRTDPWGGVEQNDFINLSLLVETSLKASELLAVAQGVEVACGRTRELRWGPRTLDIDLIRFGATGHEFVIDTEMLTLPHPRAHERAFVLVPWAELEPDSDVLTPNGRHSMKDLLFHLGDQEITPIEED